jgi:streptogramin lyase
MVSITVGGVIPAVARATAITEFPLTVHPGSDPLGVTPGRDGNLWFTDGGTTHAIGRITPSGAITEFTQGLTSTAPPFDVTMGPDGNLWFTATGSPPNAIGKVTPAGVITEYVAGMVPGFNAGSAPSNITAGPDGNLWFLDGGNPKAIGRITPAGSIAEFSLPSTSQPEELTPGPDGNMWFTDRGNTKAIGQVTPAGVIIEFTNHLDQMNSMPFSITTGVDGNLWFTDAGTPGAVGKATPSGTISEFTAGLQLNARPDATTAGPDGNVWFEDNLSGGRAVGRIKPDGSINEFSSGLGTGLEDDITVGVDGNIWVEQSSPGAVSRITPAGAITSFSNGLLPNAGSDGDRLVTGPDGNLWFNDRGAKAIGMVSLQIPPTASTGAATAVTSSSATVSGAVNPRGAATTVTFEYGTTPALGQTASAGTLNASGDPSAVSAGLIGLPAATLVYYRAVATNAFGSDDGAVQTFNTSAGPPTPTPTPTPPPTPGPTVSVATVGNQRITLTTPSTCATNPSGLSASLASTAVPNSRQATLRFLSAAFYLDRGIKHTHHTTKRPPNGKTKTVTVVVYAPNGTLHHLPATVVLRVADLRSGTHTLNVTLTYSKRVTRHGRRETVTVTKRLSVKFAVC